MIIYIPMSMLKHHHSYPLLHQNYCFEHFWCIYFFYSIQCVIISISSLRNGHMLFSEVYCNNLMFSLWYFGKVFDIKLCEVTVFFVIKVIKPINFCFSCFFSTGLCLIYFCISLLIFPMLLFVGFHKLHVGLPVKLFLCSLFCSIV